jgi:preprotein translocase subunit SecF
MKKFDIIGRTKIWLGLSAVLIVTSIALIGILGLNLGIDFTGGSLIEVDLGQEFDALEVDAQLLDAGFEGVVQAGEGNRALVRLETLTQEQYEEVIATLAVHYSEVDELRFDAVGPVIGEELKRKSLWSVAVLIILIVLYVAWAFRKVSKPVASWKYGILTIVAALHDVLIPLGVFALLGSIAGWQVDTAVIAALLTIMGYSINDTIVVFDRTRENLVNERHSSASFGEIVNKSVVQTIARSVNTSLTTLLVLMAIFLFGGSTTQPFVFALIIGIISGAYSSIFVASPLLVLWERKRK